MIFYPKTYKSSNNYDKQKSIQIELAKKMDIIFIIGNNSTNIYDECNKVCKSYCFSNLNEFYNFIKKEKITNKTKIGFISDSLTSKEQIAKYANLLEFMIYYKDKHLELTKEINKYNKSIISNENKIINDAINKFINMNNDGKFLRGCLIDLGYKLKKNDNYANYLSVAYETFETSILIHDDIIDNSLLRRGKQTIHNTYNNELGKYNNKTSIHTDLTLCIGDLGFYLTSKLINEKYGKDKNYSKLVSYYNNIVINTIKGEILDVYLPFVEQYNKDNILEENDIFEIYRLKTSWYSIVGPFILGMILANSSNKDIKKFESILEPLGIAFQIKDDILGIFSSKEILGKSVFSDIEEFKQTILYSYIKLNKKDYYNKLLKYYGKENINENDAKKVQDIIIESGSLEYANQIMEQLFDKSKTEIENLNIKENIKHILLGLITYLEIREK